MICGIILACGLIARRMRSQDIPRSKYMANKRLLLRRIKKLKGFKDFLHAQLGHHATFQSE